MFLFSSKESNKNEIDEHKFVFSQSDSWSFADKMHNYNFNRIQCCSPVSMQVKPIDKRYMRSKWNGLLYKRASAMTLNLQRTNKMTFKITIAFNKLGSTLNFDTFSNV